MRKLIIEIAGLPRAGKSDSAEYLHDAYGATIVRPSRLISDFARIMGLPLEQRSDYMRAHVAMDQAYGKNYVPTKILETPGEFVVVDGLRVPSHAAKLRGYGGLIVAQHCPTPLRFERALALGEARDSVTLAEFIRDEQFEYDGDQPPFPSTKRMMEMADYHVDGSQPADEVHAQFDQIVLPRLSMFQRKSIV